MGIVPKMAEMAINRQNRQIFNKNSNEMARASFESGDLTKLAEMAINLQIVNNILKKMAKGSFWKNYKDKASVT